MSKIDLYPNLKAPPSQAKVATGTDFTGDKFALDVNVVAGAVTGEITVSGLRVGGKNTTMNVGDTATALPATAFTGRNSMTIRNLSAVDTLYIGFDNLVTADRVIGTTSGMEVGPDEGLNFDLTDEVVVWGIAETGKTIMVKVTELA